MFGSMTGFKTKLGAVLGILTGAAMVLEAVVTFIDDGDFMAAFKKVQIGVGAIAASFIGLGIGHKIEKAANGGG